MIRAFALIIAVVCAPMAQALSCLPPDFARSYAEVAAAPERYTMVIGRLKFDAKDLPRTDFQDQMNVPQLTAVPAHLTGLSLQPDGFTGRYDVAIKLNARCFGPWCAGATPGAEVLAFVNLDTSPPSVEITPCGGHVFPSTSEVKERALSCYRGEGCEVIQRR